MSAVDLLVTTRVVTLGITHSAFSTAQCIEGCMAHVNLRLLLGVQEC